ncbi:hypothetical protein [Streptomyces sp. NL15-2K]|uniref:hypothetical protein n=1 Tax=Streptomyces sp. NL15-2K TaxID=376149 RepID=UPI000FFAC585|nr:MULTISPECIES: hypothetical protein [Actinomycetes]WKX12798.1 hypothetical protein Q4V64_36865 [Kutzneria buriramensis]GCB49957.1 hypothetical protein SNL152K_7300 [Streptomyces sp. NL15-2K]
MFAVGEVPETVGDVPELRQMAVEALRAGLRVADTDRYRPGDRVSRRSDRSGRSDLCTARTTT